MPCLNELIFLNPFLNKKIQESFIAGAIKG